MSFALLVGRSLAKQVYAWAQSLEYAPDPIREFGPAAAAAVHEAGHAVVAYILGICITRAWIGPGDDVGEVEVNGLEDLDLKSVIEFDLAGIIAEARVMSGTKAPLVMVDYHRLETAREQEDREIAWRHALRLARGDRWQASQQFDEACRRTMRARKRRCGAPRAS